MELQLIPFDSFDADAVDSLQRAEDNLRYDGDHNPLLNLRLLISDLNSAGAWQGRNVLVTPERGMISEGLDLKVNITDFAYLSCFIDDADGLTPDDDWTWRSIAQAITDRLNSELRETREALIG